MAKDRSKRLQEILKAALKLPPQERLAYLEKACGSDVELRQEAEKLLEEHDQDSPPDDRPQERR